ncbi:hypothetical protein ACFX2I_032132 [Malus domestica]|uniref:Uncharacterized protein n=3 Tax=Malus TaxID=3749 RepID=A0A498K6U5_MALDO|nr:hypothetical protein DVH24_001306 [Malus domestica]TQE12586.1 hypothetical protein C1H46_001798 [Malus baccata]
MGCGCKEAKQKPNGGLARSQGQQRGGDRLKDVGDFDRLRRSIIQKLKNNEELREVITFIVKQSAALNLEGAENVKPRHLSEGIYLEVG